VSCDRAGGHLGYLIEATDGKMLYCINSSALHFIPHGMEIPTKPWQFCTEEADLSPFGEEIEELCEEKAAEIKAWNMKYKKTSEAGTGSGKVVLL